MGQNTKIEWCHATFNPWRGCSKVSAGCKLCYAEKQAKRNPGVLGVWGDSGTRVIASESYWRQPLAWDLAAKAAGERHRVFCASMADVFEDRPELVAPRNKLWRTIEATPNLDWLLLTKRPQNIRRMLNAGSQKNVWLGTSVENQQAADERIPHLLACRDLAPVLFLSVEPLLGPVDFGFTRAPTDEDYDRRNTSDGPIDLVVTTRGAGISWCIVGGESGPNARPMHPQWARSIRDQCQAAGVPFFFKQGSQANWTNFKDFDAFPDDLKIREFPRLV